MDLKELKEKFDYKNFHWREACSNAAGQSSSPLFLSFWYGLSLILMTTVVSILMVINAFTKLNTDFTQVFLFIGTQMGVVFGYLFARKSSDNNVAIKTTNTNNGTN